MVLAFPLAAILGKLRRPGAPTYGRSTPGMVLLCLLFAGTVAVHAVWSEPPPEPASAGLGDSPPLSCPPGNEELGSFQGPGDQTTPPFETSGDHWGYSYNVYDPSGSGAFRIAVLDREGNQLPGADDPLPSAGPGSHTGSAEFAASGAYRLEIDADEDIDYALLDCSGTYPGGPEGATLLRGPGRPPTGLPRARLNANPPRGEEVKALPTLLRRLRLPYRRASRRRYATRLLS